MELTLPQAAQSNDVTGALQQLLMSRIPTPDQERWQKQARTDTMEDYQNQLRQPAMGDYTPTMQSLYSMIGHFGPGMPTGYAALKGIASGGDMLAKQEALAQAGEIAAAKLAYENAKDEDKTDVQGLVGLKALAGAGKALAPVVKMDKDGNLVVYNPSTQETRIVHSSQRGEYQRIWTKAYEQAVDSEMTNPEAYAHSVASSVLTSSPGFNPQVPERVPTAVESVSPPKPKAQPAGTEEERKYILGDVWKENQAELEKFKSNPESPQYQRALKNQEILQAEMKRVGMDTTTGAGAWPGETPTMQYKDPRARAQAKEYGGAEGKSLEKEKNNLSELHTKQTQLISQLGLIRQIYDNPNIPEGQLAPLMQQARSGMKGLGINVDPSVGPADLVNAITTNLSLLQRTANGENLMPGSMTTFEEKLLANMSPTLGLTSEGRKALTEYMMLMAQSNQRVAAEGLKMAAENKEMLPPEWSSRKQRVVREEQAKLQRAYTQLMSRFGVK